MFLHCNGFSWFLSFSTVFWSYWLALSCLLFQVKYLCAACSAFSFPFIPVCAGIQLIVGLCTMLNCCDLPYCSGYGVGLHFLFISVCTTVNESVYMVNFFLCLVAFKSAIISALTTEAELFNLIIVYLSWCTKAAATQLPSLEPSV